jgi:hypothetical protein
MMRFNRIRLPKANTQRLRNIHLHQLKADESNETRTLIILFTKSRRESPLL